ncbi:MAG: carbohydrate ABC transporter substrate-binding protein [Thiothrix sp.]|nr:carbohydrate ABC transporter substrate-binding protein [Thiothrix sp.]HPQ95656.1 ABC transporter substrate-binding protein [Thiolinea sp.]
MNKTVSGKSGGPRLAAGGLLCGMLVFAGLPVQAAPTAAEPVMVELTHWWNSLGERAALDEIRQAVEQGGARFVATPIATYDLLRERIIERLAYGYPPAITQWLAGQDMLALVTVDAIEPVPARWRGAALEAILYPEVLAEVSLRGKIAAIPVGVHIQNTAYYNAAIYRRLGLALPENWDVFLQQARRIKAAGFTPIALSDEPWQLRFVFNDILMGKAGTTGFQYFYAEQNPLGSMRTALLESMETFLALRALVDPGHVGRLWNEATDEVINGRAAMQVMGDFAKGELTARGLKPERDFFCALAPGAGETMLYAMDSFVLLKVEGAGLQQGQRLLFDVVLDPKVQAAFNSRKGGIPVRYGVDTGQLDSCARRQYQSWLRKDKSRLRLPDTTSRLRLSFVQDTLHKAWSEGWSAGRATDELIRLVDEAWKSRIKAQQAE